MLNDFDIKNDMSKETFQSKKDKIQQKALERFLEVSGKKESVKEKFVGDRKMFAKRRDVLDDYDSIAIERIIGKSDLFPISYLQTGLNVSKSVCRILIRNNRGSVIGMGTGFLIAPQILMTNNHVIENAELAMNCVAEFNYQNDENFMPCPVYTYRLDPKKLFITDENLDFTIVAVKDNPNIDKSLQDFGYISLIPEEGKILEGEYVSIIQHPKGNQKSVTLRENKVNSIFDNFIHYLTDTEPGSSGSPVFNDQWIVVALHHSGVPNPDKKGDWIANEGVRISSIANFVSKQYMDMDTGKQRLIESIFPNIKSIENPTQVPDKKIDETPDDTGDYVFSGKGYDPSFLGSKYKVSLPKLSKSMQEDVTKMNDGNYVLDYTHFSIVMCKSRCLAYFTAVNIDGKTKVDIKRAGDNWRFDSRIDEKFQYGNEVYAKNDLDRGHLVRRADPNWGDDARQANDDTFHFTNSAPQHKNLNQKIWLGLENYILNNAHNYNLRVSVFTGPVFRADDMVYRKKFKIPAEFWKVVVMVKDDGNISATAYLQTQKNMIDNLEFAYGEYETYQVSIAKIEEITGLDFGKLTKYDPIANIESAGLLIEDEKNIRL